LIGVEVVLRDDPGPSDDQVVVIHMGAGAVDVAVAAALRNFRAYQAFSASGESSPPVSPVESRPA
jgi:hypothetical protein